MATISNLQGPSIRHTLLRAVAAVALLLGALTLSTGALGATTGQCGQYSYGFEGTRLINDGISTSAGPFDISLPAGTYDIEMWSNDYHPSPAYQMDQIGEQWYFVLDNGFESPPTADVPNNAETIVTSMTGVRLDAATSISVYHRLFGGAPNSVNVECIGFTPSAIEVSPPVTQASTDPEVAPPTTVEPETTAVTVPATPEPSVTTATVPTEVKSQVETPAIAQLAVTGNNDALAPLGMLLLLCGVVLLALERRLSINVS